MFASRASGWLTALLSCTQTPSEWVEQLLDDEACAQADTVALAAAAKLALPADALAFSALSATVLQPLLAALMRIVRCCGALAAFLFDCFDFFFGSHLLSVAAQRFSLARRLRTSVTRCVGCART
jgi:hypothetical protein